MAPLLGDLRGLRAAPPPAVRAVEPAEVVVSEVCDYLASERGLAAGVRTTGDSPGCSWPGSASAARRTWRA